MKGAYPIFIRQVENDFLVHIPDFDIDTEGKSLVDAIYMARDAIGLMGIDYEDDGVAIPEANSYTEEMEGAIKTLVDVDFDEYRKKYDNRMVKKNCTIPYYLSVEAEKNGINCSSLLRDALKEKLCLA